MSVENETPGYINPLKPNINTNEPRFGYIYTRVSTEIQEKKCSLEFQVQTLSDFCSKNNIYIVKKFSDSGISGATRERPGLKELMASLKSGFVVVSYSNSRISRSTEDLLAINREIQQKGCELILMDINMDTSTITGKMVLTMMGSISQMERETLAQRISDVMLHMSITGQLIKKSHYGWKRVDGVLSEKPDEQQVIQAIRNLVTADPYITAGRIIRSLHGRGYRNRKGEKFHMSTILSILKNNNIPYKYFKEDIKKEQKLPPKSDTTVIQSVVTPPLENEQSKINLLHNLLANLSPEQTNNLLSNLLNNKV